MFGDPNSLKRDVRWEMLSLYLRTPASPQVIKATCDLRPVAVAVGTRREMSQVKLGRCH